MLGALVVVVGPASPAFACSCGLTADDEAFDRSDAVFIGSVVDYQLPPDGPVMSSTDPATWAFEVSDVYKGEVTSLQEVVSEVDGASCGLDIPQEGEFLVFATAEGNQVTVGDGQYYAGFCGGTRSTSAGPLGVDVSPFPPETVSETTPEPEDESDTEAAAVARQPEDGSTSPAILFAGVAGALVVGGAAMFVWRRRRPADQRV